jgi:hypothetical protein
MVSIIGDRVGQLGGNREYWIGRMRVVWIINLELHGGSPHLCRLRPTSIGFVWTSIWNVMMHTGHMESQNIAGVQWDSAWATHGVSVEAYAWKMCTRVRWALIILLTTSWTVAARGALRACVCHVVRFIPLQGWLLIWISTTPSDMGDGLFAAPKCRMINFIIMWW